MDTINVNDFIKKLILRDNKHIKSFIRNFSGGQKGTRDYIKLLKQIDTNRLGLPTQIQDKIDFFICKHLKPMIDQIDTIFEEINSIGEIISSDQHINTEENVTNMFKRIHDGLHIIEKTWDAFAMEELHLYFML